jgi:opacity protein-like surface antigen
MFMRKTAVTAFLFLLITGFAAAQVPTSGNVFFGYSYYNANVSGQRTSLNGWNGSIEGKLLPFIGIVADFSGYYGSQNFPTACPVVLPNCVTTFGANFTEHNYLFGPRASFSIGKIRPFAEVMIGAGHVHVNGDGSDTAFATAVGGGLDYKFFHLLALRVEGDYIHTDLFNIPQNNVRISTGLAFHF